MPRKPKDVVAFGDFQTPDNLAQRVSQLLARLGIAPAGILEPSCGKGAFLRAAARTFPDARLIGADINPDYLNEVQCVGARLHRRDFFAGDWDALLGELPEPWLILGNPPWVTVAGLRTVGSANAPQRTNEGLRGIEAMTGHGNFDISEWMIREYLRWLDGRKGAIAVLCKFTVARKVLAQAWKAKRAVAARFFAIDSFREFGVAVDAGLLLIETGGAQNAACDVYQDLEDREPSSRFGQHGAFLVADLPAFESHRALLADAPESLWRSGIKHDCASVMELVHDRNGLGETVDIEADYLFPLLKSSDVANGRLLPTRRMIVPQRAVGEDTTRLAAVAPRTWAYLSRHESRFAARRSAIYKSQPPFAIFGVGTYTFAPWKVAISGLYKQLVFSCIGPIDGKPVVFDDTVVFLPCATEAEARATCALLMSDAAQAFLRSMIFWSDKRPITAALLRRLSLRALRQIGGDLDVLPERQRA